MTPAPDPKDRLHALRLDVERLRREAFERNTGLAYYYVTDPL
jgi:hypothetical protein